MNNINNSKNNQNDELLPEYNFDYSKARPNRFSIKQDNSSVMIMLELDVAKVFKTSEEVNKALRAILSAMPEK